VRFSHCNGFLTQHDSTNVLVAVLIQGAPLATRAAQQNESTANSRKREGNGQNTGFDTLPVGIVAATIHPLIHD